MAVRPVSDSSTSSATPVPKLVQEPTSSLQPWPVIITLASHEVTIPALSAAEWLAVLMVGEKLWIEDVLPGLLGEDDAKLVEDALYDGSLDLVDLHETGLKVVEFASGRPWWVSLRVIEAARANWDLMGAELMLHGIDASRVSLSAWIDVSTVLMTRLMKPEDATMFLMQLEAAPEGEAAPEPEVSAAQFLSMS